ncbi:MAG: hypothetical protein OEU54_14400 [Gemmatimonadota bacterium]|nr:hypothetical protein [Gemmatimonadota bacterium]
MTYQFQRVDYFYVTVQDEAGSAYQLLSALEQSGVNLLAFTAVPTGPLRAQLTVFPEDAGQLQAMAPTAGLELDGPYSALLVQGDDELGALARVHEKLFDAGVNVYASTGLAGDRGRYAYVIYVRSEDIDQAVSALE